MKDNLCATRALLDAYIQDSDYFLTDHIMFKYHENVLFCNFTISVCFKNRLMSALFKTGLPIKLIKRK
jgi:hypothetical protein